MSRYPIFLQDSENSCGAYCLKMLLSYFKRDDEIRNIKKSCHLSKEGITVYGLIKVLKEYNIEAKAYSCEFKKVFDEVKLPAIVHFKIDNVYHYVVLYKIKDKYFLVGDPAKGLVKMSYEMFSKQFTGVVIMVIHVGRPINNHSTYLLIDFIKDHLKNHYKDILKMVVKTTIISILTLVFSYYYQLLIDTFSTYSFIKILLISLAFSIIYLIKLILDTSRRNDILMLSKELNNEYVLKTIQNMIYQDYAYFKLLDKGALLSRTQNLFELSQYFIEFYHLVFIDSILLILILIFIAYINMFILFVVIIMFIIIFMLFYFYSKAMYLQNKQLLQQKEVLNDGLLEFQNNYFETIQYRIKRMIKNKIGYLYDNYFNYLYGYQELSNIHQIRLEALIQLMMIITILLALWFYKAKLLTLGTVMLVYLLLSYTIDPLMKVSSFISMHGELKIIFERYKEMLPENRVKKKRIKKIESIELKHLSFSYGYQRPILQHVQLVIKDSICLQGKTGCGKSTLLKLIMGQYAPVKGEILVNGYNLQEIDLNSYYQRIKYLDKNPSFYNESLKTNLLLDNDSLEDEMIYLLRYFKLDDLIANLDIRLDETGGFLSSGQCQLIMIIRALLTKPDVLILDEAFSNIDKERVELLLAYLSKQKMIVLSVSHQINMVNSYFDCVIIESGKIKGEEEYGN